MLTGDDLSTQYFVGGAAITILGIAMTQAGWTHSMFIRGMFALGAALVICAIFWKPLTETFPRISEIANPVGSSGLGWLTLLSIGLGTIFLLDYKARIRAVAARDDRPLNPDKAALNNAIQELFERVGKLEMMPLAATDEGLSAVRTSLHSLINEHCTLADKMKALQNGIAANTTKIVLHDRSNLFVVDGLIQQLWHSLLFDSAPKLLAICALRGLTPEAMKTDSAKADDYWREVRNLLSDTRWGYEIGLTSQNAESTAELTIRDIPMTERPADIDPMDLRRFAILKYRAENANSFIQRVKAEAQSTYRACLTRLLEIRAEQKAAKDG